MGRPTLADVARAAGVSLATASRSLAGSDMVQPGTRDAVLAAATRVGYERIRAGRPCASTRRVGYVAISGGYPVRATTGAILVLPDLAVMRGVAREVGGRDGTSCRVYGLREVTSPQPNRPQKARGRSGGTGRPVGRENPPAARTVGTRGIQGAA